jgi:solute carrier family 25 (mitochondrial S-adenosylmethionine transporter), member 26
MGNDSQGLDTHLVYASTPLLHLNRLGYKWNKRILCGYRVFSMELEDLYLDKCLMGKLNRILHCLHFPEVNSNFITHTTHRILSVLTFGSYEMYKKALLERFPTVKPALIYAISAILGDLTGSGWLCPSEVIKQQTQAGIYASTGEAVSSVWKNKGLAGFYQGYLGGVARDVPFRVAQLTTFEMTKNLYLRMKDRRRREAALAVSDKGRKTIPEEPLQLSPLESAICGAVSGSISAAVTAPLDRIKTILMTDNGAYGGSVISCASKIFEEEGIRGFMTGVVPRVTYIAPSVVIFFVCYEQVQQRLKYWQTSS